MKGKSFQNGVEILFTDIAGNSTLVNNEAVKAPFSSNAILTRAADSFHPDNLPEPGYTTLQPTVVGLVGTTLKIDGLSDFDMSTLYDGIKAIPDRSAVNHVDLLTDTKAQTLNISVQDVLALGVGESYLSSGTHAGKIQMRIDGDSNDIVNFINEFNAPVDAKWTVNQTTKVTLEGITGDYFQATNIASGLELFVKMGVQINVV